MERTEDNDEDNEESEGSVSGGVVDTEKVDKELNDMEEELPLWLLKEKRWCGECGNELILLFSLFALI